MEPVFQKIRLDSIELKPLFNLSFDSSSRQIEVSMSQFGLLRPVSLFQSGRQYRIIDGLKRVNAARQLKWQELDACVYSQAEVAEADCFLMAIESNFWSRSFNLIEKSIILDKLAQFEDKPPLLKIVYELLEVGHYEQAKQYRDLKNLPWPVQRYVVEKRLSLTTAKKFLLFSDSECEGVFQIVSTLPLNQNKLDEILEWSFDISRRDAIRADAFLGSLLSETSGEENPHKKVDQLRARLAEKRHLHYENKKKIFETAVSRLNAGPHIQIKPSPHFEGDFVELKISIRDQKDIDNLKKIMDNPLWSDVLKVL